MIHSVVVKPPGMELTSWTCKGWGHISGMLRAATHRKLDQFEMPQDVTQLRLLQSARLFKDWTKELRRRLHAARTRRKQNTTAKVNIKGRFNKCIPSSVCACMHYRHFDRHG
jgi:hypothetical protein